MCDSCHRTTVDCHSGTVEIEVSGWGTWNIWLDTEPEGAALPSVLMQPRDALTVARRLIFAAVRLWWLQRRARRAGHLVRRARTG
jgi:hypothetical protein